MKIVIIGTGYVGLVSGACFAEFGWDVTCIDKNSERIKSLEKGIMPIYEPGLEDLVKKNVKEGRLSFSIDYAPHVEDADIIFIAVGTPSRRGDGYADLTFVYEAAKEIALHLKKYTVIVDKSTVPVGTARSVEKIIRAENPAAVFDVASNPEFLREGSAINDFMRPDRIVLGVENDRAKEMLKELYRPLYLIETPMVMTGLETAELIKYASNAFLATKISFINEIANLCEKVGASVKDVSKGMGLDKRIGPKFLHAGPGYGGSCFPKDVSALVNIFHDNGMTAKILESVINVNDSQKSLMVEKIRDALGGSEYNKTISFLGLTFKPETDDMREAPSLKIISALINGNAVIHTTDPQGMTEAKKLLPTSVKYFDDLYETCKGADAVVVITEWNQYRAIDLGKLKKVMKGNIFIDLRNIYNKELVEKAGFIYSAVGMPVSRQVREQN
ncbi:MAG: UDP-glucose/GDP-mannose dehydrogenase family protein [Spirochaetaceae bacterium]|nr:UDP-glucose/GDP-mannose dehydrogenase family protein [Spirochaetaceae bacterium]